MFGWLFRNRRFHRSTGAIRNSVRNSCKTINNLMWIYLFFFVPVRREAKSFARMDARRRHHGCERENFGNVVGRKQHWDLRIHCWIVLLLGSAARRIPKMDIKQKVHVDVIVIVVVVVGATTSPAIVALRSLRCNWESQSHSSNEKEKSLEFGKNVSALCCEWKRRDLSFSEGFPSVSFGCLMMHIKYLKI